VNDPPNGVCRYGAESEQNSTKKERWRTLALPVVISTSSTSMPSGSKGGESERKGTIDSHEPLSSPSPFLRGRPAAVAAARVS
jgi:hypothetical protein